MAKKLPPIYPGEILREEFLVPLKLTPYAVAAALHVPRTRIERIAREEKPVTADTALRLGKFFKTGAAFWMNIQARLRSRNGRRCARAADQEDRGLQGGMRAVVYLIKRECLVHCHRNSVILVVLCMVDKLPALQTWGTQ